MKYAIILAGVAPFVALALLTAACGVFGDDDETPPIGDTPLPTSPVSETPSPDQPVSATPGATAGPAPTATALPDLPSDRRAEPAPIDGLDIVVAESFPPQYFLHVQAGLPNGCAWQYGYEVERAGGVIAVAVLNSMPADPNTVCTMIYGRYELNIPLGSDFESGETYTVKVNDKEITFTAQ